MRSLPLDILSTTQKSWRRLGSEAVAWKQVTAKRAAARRRKTRTAILDCVLLYSWLRGWGEWSVWAEKYWLWWLIALELMIQSVQGEIGIYREIDYRSRQHSHACVMTFARQEQVFGESVVVLCLVWSGELYISAACRYVEHVALRVNNEWTTKQSSKPYYSRDRIMR